MKRIILTTGGTGGHIFPAIAVAEEIRRRYPDAMLLFVGGRYGPEGDMAANAGLDFVGLPVKGVLGRGLKGVAAAVGMSRGLAGALKVMRRVKPQLVVGFGGYAAFAGVLAGRMAGAATAIHEQNSLPGMTNKWLGKVVKRIFLSMPDVSGAFSTKKTRLTGNPVRASISELHDAILAGDALKQPWEGEGRPFRLLVMGGSQGAKALNRGVLAALPRLLETGMEIRHQTGQADYEETRAAYRKAGATHVRVEPFIADMAAAYAWADLALCRAGASSLAELTATGTPAVLVPFPHAARDHQRQNARFLEHGGGAVVLEQSVFQSADADPQALARAVLDLMRDPEHLGHMRRRCLDLAMPHAARTLVDELEILSQGK